MQFNIYQILAMEAATFDIGDVEMSQMLAMLSRA